MELPQAAEKKRLQALLKDLAEGLEDLMVTGLATASQATLDKVDVAFKEASGRRLLRLGSTLRILNQEMRRYLDDDDKFSKRRFGLFAGRAWILSRRMAQVVETGDVSEWQQLTRTPTPQPVPRLVVVALGVAKNVAEGVFCGFDFRLRVLEVDEGTQGQASVRPGDSLLWSAIYPMKNPKIAPDTYLQLMQPQKFRPSLLLEKPVQVAGAAIAEGRLFLGPKTRVEEAATDFSLDGFTAWAPDLLLDHWSQAEPGPLDLDAERRQEVVLTDWTLGKRSQEPLADRHTWKLTAHGLQMTAAAKSNLEGKELSAAIERLRRLPEKGRPPLFGLLHFELCRLVFQPLSSLGNDRPKHLMIAKTKIGAAELLKSIDLKP